MKHETDDFGYYKTYTFEEFIVDGCPEDIPIGFFKIYRDTIKL